MQPNAMMQNPFAVLTFIAAPALLTNASCVLALSTINRMLRTRDRMQDLYDRSESKPMPEPEATLLVEKVNRVELQAEVLLRALYGIYLAIGSFSAATLVTLLGAALASFQDSIWLILLAGLGLLLGFVGVGGLVAGSIRLLQATRLSLINIRSEAARIRERHVDPMRRK